MDYPQRYTGIVESGNVGMGERGKNRPFPCHALR